MATSYITRTPGSSGNRKKWTLSGWYKFNMSTLASGYWANTLFCGSNGTNYMECSVNNASFMDWVQSTGGLVARRTTNRKFRDQSAFYHFVWVWDSENATPADRMKIYVNGVQQTSFSATTDPSSGLDSDWNFTYPIFLGSSNGGSPYYNGVMSNVQFVDGSALAPTEFGQFNSTDGMWEIKTDAYATPGAQGFFLKMEDSTNLDLDSSTNAHTFSTTGTLISTKDNPSNNLCTNNWVNPTVDTTNDSIKNIGNTALVQQASFRSVLGTLGVQAGKWYAEFKLRTAAGTSNYSGMGIVNVSQSPEYALGSATTKKIGEYGNTVGYFSGGAVIRNASTVRTDSTFTSGDIISIAMDCDNGFVYWAKNNVWQNSGVPTSGATGTGGYNFFTYLGTGGIYVMGVTGRSGSSAPYFDVNWGNGAYANANFGSPNADDNGFGAFTYAPPTGFLTMCTKNISTNG